MPTWISTKRSAWTAPSSGAPCTRGRSAIPELPEVETVRRELAPWLRGRTIRAALRIDTPPGPKSANLERAVGARIEGVERRGKFLLLPLALDGVVHDELVIHLGMTGVLSPRPPDTHERVRLLLDGPPPAALHFKDPRRFGRFLVVPRGDHRTLPTLAAMGPEPLGDDFTPEGFAVRLTSSVAIKTLLLSQRPVAGVGNIYADEALWRARIHPLTPADELTAEQIRALHAAIRAVLTTAVAHQGTTLHDYRTVNGAVGAYAAQLDVYGHAGDACRRCGAVIARLVVGARGTHVCMRCQPPPNGAKVPARPRARR